MMKVIMTVTVKMNLINLRHCIILCILKKKT